jgi:hypothetical protein
MECIYVYGLTDYQSDNKLTHNLVIYHLSELIS